MYVLARLRGFQKLTPIDVALKTFLDTLQPKRLQATMVPLHAALNRVLSEDIVAGENLPSFDRSAVDGYAVKAEDTVGATQFKPRTLQMTSETLVGSRQAKQLWTGNLIPKGANAVIMLENTKRKEEEIEVWVSVTPAENVSRRGEDVSKGEVALKAGTRLRPHHLGLLAALGKTEAPVVEKPKVAVLATGNELVETGKPPRENQIFDANRLVLSALCRELETEPLDLGISRDDVDEISEKLKFGLQNADAVITSGGTSVGGSDLVPDAVNKIGKPGIIVHGVAMRPGMPTALAVVNKKPIVILPGNPVAAMIGFEVFVRPLVWRLLGAECETRPVVQAKMTGRIVASLGRKTFVRVRVSRHEGVFLAEPVSARGSSMISTMTKANGYVIVSENREGLEEGEIVDVSLFGCVEVVDDDV